MENIKLLVFDIDGTLIDRSKHEVEESAKDAINQARANGYQILVATGRSFFLIHEDVRKSINTDYYVTVNGACLNDNTGAIIHTNGFDTKSVEALITFCEEKNYTMGIKYDDFIGVYGDFETFAEAYIGLDHPNIDYLKADTENNFYETHTPLGVFAFAPSTDIPYLESIIPDLRFMPSDKVAIEAIKKGVDKTKNIEDVLNRLNLTWDNVISFGDGFNDIDMLQAAKYSVAMGNAAPAVQASATYVTDHILENGIANALKHFKII